MMKSNSDKKIKLPTAELPAKAIWLTGGGEKDEYAEFQLETKLKEGHNYRLRISCDGDYNIFSGEALLGFGRYSDFPEQLVYDEYEFDVNCDAALNLLFWHIGIDSQTHKAQPAYAVFTLFCDGELVEASGEKSLSRLSTRYIQHRGMIITGQQGPGYACDNISVPGDFYASEVKDLCFDAVRPRPNEKLEISEKIECALVKSGSYMPIDGTDAAERMNGCTKEESNKLPGRWFLFDIGREEVGFPEIVFDCQEECTLDFGWGEHIADGMCRVAIGGRRFTSELHAAKGRNRFFPALRRLGCRYMQFFAPAEITNPRITFNVVSYPVKVKETALEGLRKRIYDTAIHTLRCCIHEHYEDCPWREQAQYTLDSRNQMLAGYSVFKDGNLPMVRASLDLESRGIRPDGLMQLCFPAGRDFPIPCYTLAYFIQFSEYIDKSGDLDFAREKLPVLEALLADLMDRSIEDGPFCGLIPRFPDSKHLWNFYEWSEGMDGAHYDYDEENPPVEAPFNAFFVLALRAFASIVRALGEEDKAAAAEHIADDVADAITYVFGRPDGYFDSFSDRKGAKISVLTQALCLLAGAKSADTEKPLAIIDKNSGENAVPATLSMACWRYDALLMHGREQYAPSILEEIDRDGRFMLEAGSTTFWETLRGDADFHNAGSLCHGWSAMAARYYDILSDFL